MNPVVLELPEEIFNLYQGLLKYIKAFGYEVRSEKIAESITLIENHINRFPELYQVAEAETEQLPQLSAQLPELLSSEPALDAEIIPAPAQPKVVRPQGQVINIDAAKKPAFFAALGNLANKFSEIIGNENKTEDHTGEPDEMVEPQPEEVEIEIILSPIPNISEDQQHIIDLIRVVTNNEIVTRGLISSIAGSMNKFCKNIAEQSYNLKLAGEIEVAYSKETVYLLLIRVIDYDAINFEINE